MFNKLILLTVFFGIAAAQFLADPCTRLDCNNHGTCLGFRSAPICLCDLSFSGLRCEIAPISGLFDGFFNLFEPAAPFGNLADPWIPFAPVPVDPAFPVQPLPGFNDWIMSLPNQLFPWMQPANGMGSPIFNSPADPKIDPTTSEILSVASTLAPEQDTTDSVTVAQAKTISAELATVDSGIARAPLEPLNDFPASNFTLPLNDGLNVCGPQDCNNKGVCVGTKVAPVCLCYLGYSGTKCEKNAFEAVATLDGSGATIICAPSDCSNNGVCLGTKASFTCVCKLGYAGQRCESTPYPLCDITDCNNNGLCIGTKNQFTCACHLGFSGQRCEQASGTLCDFADCNSNGLCLGTKTEFTCLCNIGYQGKRCETRLIDQVAPLAGGLFCELKDCSNNGLCLGTKILPTCLCAPGYLGLRCEIEPLCFSPLQCTGNGLCLGTMKNFICTCNLGWTGPNCQYFAGLGK